MTQSLHKFYLIKFVKKSFFLVEKLIGLKRLFSHLLFSFKNNFRVILYRKKYGIIFIIILEKAAMKYFVSAIRKLVIS